MEPTAVTAGPSLEVMGWVAMKKFPLALVIVLASPIVSAHEPAPPEPTALESFVARPTVVLDLAEVVGTIRSTDATVSVAAIVATDIATAGERMTGLRFVMENQAGAEQVYLDDIQLVRLRDDLADIENGIPELEAEDGAPVRIQGTGACWMPPQPMRILCPSYRVGPEGSSFGLAAYGGRGFSYPGERPATLAALVKQGLAQLGVP